VWAARVVPAFIRFVGRRIRALKHLVRSIGQISREPGSPWSKAQRLARVWRRGGVSAVKRALANTRAAGERSDAWREYRQRFEREVMPELRQRAEAMRTRPRISIVVPTYNTPEPMLREMLSSVRAQLYSDWELCVADDGSSARHVVEILKEAARTDHRITLVLGAQNRGVSFASNRALELVTGEFVVLLDHDDILEPQALFRVAESITEDNPDMVYSDEVLVTPDATAVKQYVYRPAFSPEFLRGHPYIVHLVGFRTELVKRVGGFDETLRISQDYDLILRVSELARTVVHIPDILYQWRVHTGSAGHRKMDEVMATSKAVLQRHLDRCGEPGTVIDGPCFNFFDARYPLLAGLKVAIVIPAKNLGGLLRRCVESIRATVRDVDYRILVIDHESDDPETVAYLAELGTGVDVLHYSGPFNFSAMNNRAIAQLPDGFSHCLFCSNDIEALHPGWLHRMLERAQQRSIGVVGAKLLYPDRQTIQHAGVCVGAFGRGQHYATFLKLRSDRLELGYFGGAALNHEVAAVTAACLLIRRDVFEELGGFDESLVAGFSDVDLCLRAGKRGYRVVLCPHAELVHHESAMRGTDELHPDDTARFRSKWHAYLAAGDPYYNPGLFLESTTLEVRRRLRCTADVVRRVVRRHDPNRGS
jgi:GT2 family glycosyltransferase